MRKFKRLTLTLALLLTAVGGAWAQDTYNVTFKANNKTTTVENVTLPKTFQCSYNNADGDLDLILKELYGWTGDSSETICANWSTPKSSDANKVVAGKNGNDHYITIDNVFEGTVTITGDYIVDLELTQYSLEISIAEPTEWSLKPDADKKVWTLDKMPASNVELQVEYEPTKVTMAANDKAMGTVEVAAQSKVEWTADTWKGWTANTKEYTVGDITITSTQTAYINESTEAGDYLHSLSFFVNQWKDNSTVTFSTTGDPFSRIEFTMIEDYSDDWNPSIIPNDNWTFEGKSAVWEGEATKSLTLQSCSTFVSKITFFQGAGAAIPDGVTVNGDGTFTVAKTATVTLKATPKEGYKFLYWKDDQNNTNPVREVTIESGMADKTYTAVFAEITYNVTFVEGTNLDEWSATPATEVTKDTKVDIKYTGAKKVIGVKVEKKVAEPVADIIWDGTNVTDLNVESTYASYTKEGVKLSGNADQVQVKWNNSEYLGKSGMEFITMESGGFTFTAPTGKKFTKIEMKALGSSGWAQVNLGTGWAYNTGTVTWNGSAASTVKLLKDADMFSGDFISSIAFYLSE